MTEVRELSGRKALVTGAAQGLGAAFARALARAGASVALVDREERVRDTAAAIRAVVHGDDVHGDVHAGVHDLTDPAAVRAAVDEAAEALGGLDIVVNNAAVTLVSPTMGTDWDDAVELYGSVFDINTRAVFLVGRAAMPHLVRAGAADIVNITTDHIHTCGYPVAVEHPDGSTCPFADRPRAPLGNKYFDLYDASKWALKGYTQVWARALGSHGVRVNSFGMGATDTPTFRGFLRGEPPASTLDADDVAAVLVDLLAEGPGGRTGDSVMLWPHHPLGLPPVSLDGSLAGLDS
ncbi:SDR family NAD(P)-dependent oxidoreductase [Pseudonocardia xishanensis]|uniref:NAD(P)-dependent dehydrogenase (Short-subunit alcohol dehydrogenase family) n=1 Tax=Pseudonocardia xishanensis TaxID=630995 RepID=A0ABP8RYC0_9PSEU